MSHLNHNCEDSPEERTATQDKPYHYVGSGLPNVYLSGIKYFVCRECGKQAADIPALTKLLTAISRTIVEKSSSLTGPEVRFLRKRLSKKAVDFAVMIGIAPESLSRIEGDQGTLKDAGRDKLIRMVYRILSGDKKLQKVLSEEKEFTQWMTTIFASADKERLVGVWKKHWHVSQCPAVLAA